MPKRTIQQWFDAYGVSHQNSTNKAIHWICVPVIYFCVIGFLWSIPVPDLPPLFTPHLWAKIAVGLVCLFYLRLSFPIMLGMALWSIACLAGCAWLDAHAPWPLWTISLVLFIAAWIGQFYGHKIEGAKPSFLEDLQFLMIGPAWLMGSIFRRFGLGY
ncbi:MAG: DUF962 domain-containing protein [Flavobacteriales bacterium]|nr:DUF962 domain-containing protein [Flavobacteriales bacterium]